MPVQYHDPEKPDMIDGEWRSPKCNAKAQLEIAIVSMPGASETGSVVEQGQGDATKPWYMQGVNGGTPERLATQATLADLLTSINAMKTQAVPSTTAGVPKTPKTVPTGTAEAIVGTSTPAARMVRVQVEFDASKPNAYVCIGDSSVTLENGEQLSPGDVYSEAVDDAQKLFCIGSEAGLKLRIKVL